MAAEEEELMRPPPLLLPYAACRVSIVRWKYPPSKTSPASGAAASALPASTPWVAQMVW